MTTRYAESTEVSVDRSRSQIEKLLSDFGADQFLYGWNTEDGVAIISFRAHGRHIHFELPLPMPDDHSILYTPSHARRTDKAARTEYEKAVRARWRALHLLLKAKIVGINEGLASFEDEFLAYTVLPDNSTVGQWADDQVREAYRTGTMPSLLPGVSRSPLRLSDKAGVEP